jgi:hypothetical protein
MRRTARVLLLPVALALWATTFAVLLVADAMHRAARGLGLRGS